MRDVLVQINLKDFVSKVSSMSSNIQVQYITEAEQHFHHSPGDSAGKDSACNAEDLGSTPGLGRSPGEGTPFQYFGWRISWSHKESDTTERLSLFTMP